MNNSIKQSIKAITEGAIFTAIYGILAIISRYLLMGTDSLLYYFTPLPISLYIAKNKLSYSITVLFASILLSFLFADPIITALVIVPNIIVGFGLTTVIIPCTTLLYSMVSKQDMTNASSVQNLIKNVGCAVGTSSVGFLVSSYSQIYQSYLV